MFVEMFFDKAHISVIRIKTLIIGSILRVFKTTRTIVN